MSVEQNQQQDTTQPGLSLMGAPAPEDHAPGFDVVLRGYDRDQVERHVGWLESLLTQAERDTEQSRAALEQAYAELERARTESAQARAELERGRPSYDALGKRIAQMLTLAEEEAQEMRAQAAADIDRAKAAMGKEQQDFDKRRAEIVGTAQREASAIVSAAHQQAERTVAEAQQRAQQLEAHAQQRVAELARQRDEIRAHLSRLQQQLAAMGLSADTPPDERPA